MKHLHILGISGTFMCGLAILAKQKGFVVTGCDANCYPPISDLLCAEGIEWVEGYDVNPSILEADCVIVGNAVKRGMPIVELLLNARKDYISGPQWLAENILVDYRVMAVSGTHGKTTTTSMLAFILEKADLKPSFLIGGVASNFNKSAHLGKGAWFVIEADEYDTAFFDKRPKLMHYRPEVAIVNNLEFDHADIYADLDAIQTQFHYFLKTIPSDGLLIKPYHDDVVNQVVKQGLFSEVVAFGLQGEANWRAEIDDGIGQHFRIWYKNKVVAKIHWSLLGKFNVENALAAIAASFKAGVHPQVAAEALQEFKPVKRRLELKLQRYGISLYDDFAHHPTAITKTLLALKESKRHDRILAVLELGSYTMKKGLHVQALAHALAYADFTFILNPTQFVLAEFSQTWQFPYQILPHTQSIITSILEKVQPGDAILIMSNRHFDNIHADLIRQLNLKWGLSRQ